LQDRCGDLDLDVAGERLYDVRRRIDRLPNARPGAKITTTRYF